MKKKSLPILEDITITGIAAEGKAMTRINDLVCFVPYCVPGDVVDLQVTKKKHSFMEARVLRLKQASLLRCEAVCPHYGTCGGCKWQVLPYPEQLKWKQQQVEDNLTRIGKIELPTISPILGSKKTYQYRNKLEFAFADHKWLTTEQMKAGVPFEPGLGFHITNNFDKVLQIDELEKAVKAFDAAAKSGNELIAPMSLKKAGLVYLELDNKQAAHKCFVQIRDNYPQSQEAQDIEKFIALAQ